MSNQSDYDAWLEGISDFHTALDDAWSRMFVMHLGTALPDKRVREKFRQFITDWCMHTTGRLSATEHDMIEVFPEFLETLVDDNK
jgi:hypothetical protein